MAKLLAKGLRKTREQFKAKGAYMHFGAEDWLRHVMRPLILKQIAAKFAREGSNSKWTALAERTVEERIRQGFGGRSPILKRTGELLFKVTYSPEPWGDIKQGNNYFSLVFAFNQLSGSSSSSGDGKSTVAEQAAALQGGDVNLPARPFVTLTSGDRSEVRAAFKKFWDGYANIG